jgi:hypothetical protein
MPLRGNPLGPSGCRRRRGGLSGPSWQVAFGRARAVHGILTSGRATDGALTWRGNAEDRVLVKNLKRVDGIARCRLLARSARP